MRRCRAFDWLYQSRMRTGFADNNLAIARHIINRVRLNTSRKASIKTKRLFAASSDQFRAELRGFKG